MSFFDDESASPATGSATPRRERPGGRLVIVVVVGLALLVGLGWGAAAYAAEDKVPRGTTVAGVDIGGRAAPEAVDALGRGLAEREVAPVVVEVGERTIEVDPAEAGLSVDHEATVAAAGGSRSWDPRRLWAYYTGGSEVEPVLVVDDERLDAAVARVARRAGRPARDGEVRLTGNGVRTVEAVNGTTLEPGPTREALVAGYLGEEPVALELVPVVPDIDETDVRTAVEEVADPALSAPVTLVLGEDELRLSPGQIARTVSLVPERGVLVPRVDQRRLRGVVRRSDATRTQAPVDATIRLVDGSPQVVPSTAGVQYPVEAVGEAMLRAARRPEARRTVEVDGVRRRPEVSTRDVRRLGVREQVSDFSTYYPDAEYRNVNLGRASDLIDGTLLAPGETFSLNDTVGERTRENGFTEGFIISDGILREDLGGGVSQMATTLFNAMYFAGLEDVEHSPHSFYIDRYPVGREATVAWGAIDLRFRNDTDHGVLIDTEVTPSTAASQGEVRVRMYSTKTWDITSRTSQRYAFTEPETRELSGEDCYAYTGSSGFQVDVFRTFRRPGDSEVVRTQKFHTVYTPSDGVECVPEAEADAAG